MSRVTQVSAVVATLCVVACGGEGADGSSDDGAAGSAHRDALAAGAPSRFLFVWAGDADRADSDFLAVLNADSRNPAYGTLITTLPVGRIGTWPHHTEHRMPASGHLFANGFLEGVTFRFDLTEPETPRLLGSFTSAAGFTYPHSYERLPNGHVLATFQGRGGRNVDPGGLVELTDSGEIVRAASAADSAAPGALLRPYSLAPVPELDRVVVTSYDMGEDMGFRGGRRGRTHVVQVWRLSEPSVLATIDLPPGPGGGGDEQPGEPRVLADGRTVLVTTFTCGLYRIAGLGSETPSAEFIYDFNGGGCALPVVVGDYWIQSIPSAHAVVALDVSDPSHPREVSRVTLGPRNFPHWLALDPAGDRIVVVDRGDGEPRIFVLTVDPATGELAVDSRFPDSGSERPGVDFGRAQWPHGRTGAARPHGAVFGF